MPLSDATSHQVNATISAPEAEQELPKDTTPVHKNLNHAQLYVQTSPNDDISETPTTFDNLPGDTKDERDDEPNPTTSFHEETTVLVDNTSAAKSPTVKNSVRSVNLNVNETFSPDLEDLSPPAPPLAAPEFLLKTAKTLVRSVGGKLCSKVDVLVGLKGMVDALKVSEKPEASKRVKLLQEAGAVSALAGLVKKFYRREKSPDTDIFFWTCGVIHYIVKYDDADTIGSKMCQLGIVPPLQQALAHNHVQLEAGGATLQVLAQIVKSLGTAVYFDARGGTLHALLALQTHPTQQIVCHPAIVLIRHLLKQDPPRVLQILHQCKGFSCVGGALDYFGEDRVLQFCGRKILVGMMGTVSSD